MAAFETFRSELLTAVRDATVGYSDIFVASVSRMPAIAAPGAVAEWLRLLSGDGGGLISEARFMSTAPSASVERRAAWRRVYELAVGLREVLRELPEEPAKASCPACEAFGCSGCDGTGTVFGEARAA